MAYKLKGGEGFASGLRRIAAEEIDAAIAQLQGRGDPDVDKAVHDARKRLKKTRAALRLAREDIGNSVRRRENVVMRDAARRLSGARDAQVLIETLDDVSQRTGLSLPADGVAALRSQLVAARERKLAEIGSSGGAAAEAADELSSVRERIESWPLDDEGFESASRGLERIHSRGRDAMRDAFEKGDDEAWHEWRKRVKDLWYSLRVVCPVAPVQLGGMVKEADELSDVLGDHNDVAVLRAALDQHGDALEPGHSELIRAALDRRRDDLRLAAEPLARRLYAERPKAFARRLRAYWNAREAEAEARAYWIVPELAGAVRRLLERKEGADAAKRRRVSRELRDIGFTVSDFADDVPRRRGGFSAEDFDELVGRGRIRIGSPPSPAPEPPARERDSDAEPKSSAAEGDGMSPLAVVALPAQAAERTVRWARKRLPL